MKHLFADGAYDRLKLMDKAASLDFVVEIIRRSDTQKSFKVRPRRWVVERSFGWMIRWRRIVRDYGARVDVSEAMVPVAMGGNVLRRTTHPRISKQTLSSGISRLSAQNVPLDTAGIAIIEGQQVDRRVFQEVDGAANSETKLTASVTNNYIPKHPTLTRPPACSCV